VSIETDIAAVIAGTPINLGGVAITAGDLKSGLSGLQKFPLADLTAAVTLRLANVPDDFVVAEDVVSLLGDFGLPDAAVGVLGIKALAWVVANNRSATPGSLTREGSGSRGSDPFDE
jgi:hypothetical protein